MKYLISLITLLFWLPAISQSLTHEDFEGYDNMELYYNGAMNIAKAATSEPKMKKLYYEDAIECLKPIPVDTGFENRYMPMEVSRIDVKAMLPVDTTKNIDYTYEYAIDRYNDKKIKERATVRGKMSKYMCRVKTFAIEPGKTVKLGGIMEGRSIVIAFTEPGKRINLTVEGAERTVGTSYENGMVSVCKWDEPEEMDMIYEIENPNDSVVSLVLITN